MYIAPYQGNNLRRLHALPPLQLFACDHLYDIENVINDEFDTLYLVLS